MAILNLIEFTLLPVVLLWLGICVWHDLKNREVPVLLTVVPLASACLVGVLFGRWAAACLVAVLILLSDLATHRTSWGILAAALIALSDPTSGMLIISIVVVWMLWDFGAMGGADAKILISLLLLWGSGLVLVPVALAGGFQGLMAWWRKKREIPYTVAILLGSAGYWLAKLI